MGFQASVGQLELISDIHTFTPQANASIFLSSSAAAGTRVLYSSLLYAGWANARQCLDSTVQEVAHMRILHKGWANSSSSAISLHVHCRAM